MQVKGKLQDRGCLCMQDTVHCATVGGECRNGSYMNIFKELINPHDPGSVSAILVLFTAEQLYKVSKTYLSQGTRNWTYDIGN